MKKLTELDKSEKILLLKSIAAGEVDRAKITPDAFVAIAPQDLFLAMMMKGGNPETKIVLIGEAAAVAKKEFPTDQVREDAWSEY